MRLLISIFIFLILISCHKDEVEVNETCGLSNRMQIQNLKMDAIPSGDTLNIKFDNIDYNLRVYTVTGAFGGYDYKLSKKEAYFSNYNNDIQCQITIYYPADSSYFNNRSYLTKFRIRDNDTPKDRQKDSLVFIRQCSFDLYINVLTNAGEEFKSVDKDNVLTDFYKVDSIKYIKRINFDYSQYKVYGHFQTLVIDKDRNQRTLNGRLTMQFETNKR